MQKMKNSFQAFVENNRFQELVASNREEVRSSYVEERDSSQYSNDTPPEGEVVSESEEQYPLGEEREVPYQDEADWERLDLSQYPDEALEAVLRRGDLQLLNEALAYMGRDEFESRFYRFEEDTRKLASICLEQGSVEMAYLVLPYLERYVAKGGVHELLNLSFRDDISADFVRLVLKMNPDDKLELLKRGSSEVPMKLFISSSIHGRDDLVQVLLSISDVFRDAFNSEGAKEIFIERFQQILHYSHRDGGHDYLQEIGFLLDKNPDLATLKEVQQAFIVFAKELRSGYSGLEFLINKSPIFAELYKTEVHKNFIDNLIYDPFYELIEFLLRQDPTLAENIEIQQAFEGMARGYDRNARESLKCLLNVHPDFAGKLFGEEIQSDNVLKNMALKYEKMASLLKDYPTLIMPFNKAINSVLEYLAGDIANYELITYLLNDAHSITLFDENVQDALARTVLHRDEELRDVRIDELLKLCPGIGKFFSTEFGKRLKNHFAAEKLDYEGIESLLKYDPDLGKKCHVVIAKRFSDDIKSENPNYEEIQFLSTKFPFIPSSYYYSFESQDLHRLFDKALRDEKTEFIKFLLQIKPELVTYELHYNNNGKSIIERAKNGLLPEDITASVLKVACELIYDMIRRESDRYGYVANRELYKCLGDSLFDDALSSAGRRDFTNIDLILSYFDRSYMGAREIRHKFLKVSAARGDIDTVEHIIDTLPSGDSWMLHEVATRACNIALDHGQGEFVWHLVNRFTETLVPRLVSERGNVLQSIVEKTATPQGVNIVKHLLFVDALRQGMKPDGLNAYVDQLKLLCTTSKASYFAPLPDEVRCKIGEFLLDKRYQPYAKLKLRVQPSAPEDTLHIEEATRYMTKVIMTIVNECLTHPLVGEQLHVRTNQCFKWIQDKMTKSMGKLGVISKSLQIELVHDVWQAMVDQPSHKPRVKKAVEDAIDAVLGQHLLLEADTHALGLAGEHYEPYEAKDGEYAAA